jgi:hypothetical protein
VVVVIHLGRKSGPDCVIDIDMAVDRSVNCHCSLSRDGIRVSPPLSN